MSDSSQAGFGKSDLLERREQLDLLPLEEAWLGREISCPRPSCDGRMRVNPFITIVRRLPPRRLWWAFWRRR